MAAIERAAMAAMEKDLSSNPKLRHQYGKQVNVKLSQNKKLKLENGKE